jgi:hypothetical protein
MAINVLVPYRDQRLRRTPVPNGEINTMLGWMMVFALIAILAAVVNVAGGAATASISMTLATVVFGALFLACLLTAVARGRA